MLLGALPFGTKHSPSLGENKNDHNCRFLLLCGGYVLFLILGAAMFSAIEAPKIDVISQRVDSFRKDFLDKNTCLNDDDLEEFLAAIITANDRGISPLHNASNEMNWGFGQAIFFSGSVLTTIGYGRVAPLSQTGKLFCMFYAIIGIPYTLMIIGNIVSRLTILTDQFLGLLNSKLGHLYQPFNIRVMHLTIIVIIVGILFFLVPTMVFAYLEPSWALLDAFYYCFISLTTIGLGDYVPGAGVSNENQSLYKICITAYLILGLIAMMLILSIYSDIPQTYLGQTFTDIVNDNENEKSRLSGKNTTSYSGTGSVSLYMPQRDEDNRRAVVRVRPHGDDSPSPDEAPSSSIQSRDVNNMP